MKRPWLMFAIVMVFWIVLDAISVLVGFLPLDESLGHTWIGVASGYWCYHIILTTKPAKMPERKDPHA